AHQPPAAVPQPAQELLTRSPGKDLPMRLHIATAILTAALVLTAPALAAEPPGDPGAEGKADGALAPAPPPPASVKQTLRLGGRALAYTVTVGALPVLDKGKRIG